MAIIGNSLSPYFTATTSDVFSANGTGTTFTLTRSISNLSDIEVLVNNIQQNPFNGAYSVNGNTLTFSEAPSSGANNVLINYRQAVIGSTIPTPNTVASASLQRDLTLGGNTTSNGTLFTQALVPTANVTYDIGTSTLRYKDIYLSGTTIKLGDVSLSASGNTFTVANSTGGTLPSSMGNTTIVGTANVTGDMTIGGNLTITGTMTYINTTDLNIGDAIISLNADLGSGIAPTEDAGININRGASTNAQFKWIESTDNWSLGNTTISGVLSANTATLTNALPLTSGGTGANSAPYAMANLMGYTTTATAAGTTTLDNTSSFYQIFTGTTTQTVVLPVTSTLQAGWTFHICNNSTGALTVNSSGGNLVISVIAGVTVMVTCIGTTLTTAADWEAGYTDFSTLTGTGNVVLSTGPTLVGMTVTGGLSLNGSATSAANFHTTQTTGVLTVGGTAGTANIVFGRSTATQTTYIQAGATANNNTKNIEIGTSGLSGSNTNITLGSAVSGANSTTIINGNLGLSVTPGLYIGYNTASIGPGSSAGGILQFQGTSGSDVAHIRADRSGATATSLTIETRTGTSAPIYFGTNGSNTMALASNGNVGINSTTPTTKLNVYFGALEAASFHEAILHSGYGSASNLGGKIGITFSGHPNAPTGGSTKTAGVYGVSTDATQYARSMGLSFHTSSVDAASTEKMRIDSAGNVGIGNTSPSYKLDVTGTAHVSSYAYLDSLVSGYIPHTGVIGFGGTVGGAQTIAKLKWGSYGRIQHTSFTNTPFISFNAELYESDYSGSGSGQSSRNYFRPDYAPGSYGIISSVSGGVAFNVGNWSNASSIDIGDFVNHSSYAGGVVANGNWELKKNLAIGGVAATTSGTGITFPAALNASSDANTLDDYEEGTWTPAIGGTSSDPTVGYSYRSGVYTKVGRMVYIQFGIKINSISGGSGELRITGLPFTSVVRGAYQEAANSLEGGNWATAAIAGKSYMFTFDNSTYLGTRYQNNADTAINVSDVGSGQYVNGILIYHIS